MRTPESGGGVHVASIPSVGRRSESVGSIIAVPVGTSVSVGSSVGVGLANNGLGVRVGGGVYIGGASITGGFGAALARKGVRGELSAGWQAINSSVSSKISRLTRMELP